MSNQHRRFTGEIERKSFKMFYSDGYRSEKYREKPEIFRDEKYTGR
jgi:hypothetical protein